MPSITSSGNTGAAGFQQPRLMRPAKPFSWRYVQPTAGSTKPADTPMCNAAALYHMCGGIDGEGPEFAYVPLADAHKIERATASRSASALQWEPLEYDETEWSSEPREGDEFTEWCDGFLLMTVKRDGQLWRTRIPWPVNPADRRKADG